MTHKEFADKYIKIEYIEQSKSFGHHPFVLLAVMPDGKTEFNSMVINGVYAAYARAAHYFQMGATEIYMSLDFPQVLDSGSDFIAIFSITNNDVDGFSASISGVPYDPSNGQILPLIGSSCLKVIFAQFISFFPVNYKLIDRKEGEDE